ncbi:hypothetical protein L207DRAFT_612721 [Hyaloscypha variabilis F]|uniref:Uncharacterized protein n=1 Tax=Hyaloscypha variabilis (strain UAMH 11265 / GT02V1 / F) TaxID=1149755 RepID=A0A2J6S636_HYAVF|nr:hypothetical protein L207DRAFT_612721 [Hyaloscypha variabilis F]
MANFNQRIFCCKAAGPVPVASNIKLHNDPNREVHEAIFRSFLAFAVRRQDLADFIEEAAKARKQESARLLSLLSAPAPVFTLEALKNNPLTPQVPYVMHLTSRVNFGPVYSHRYFACPWDLQNDWVEMSLVHWFAAGEPFKMKAEKWDVKCEKDEHFFRLTLRPNLAMRPVAPTPVAGVHYAHTLEGTGVQYGYCAETGREERKDAC